MKAIDAAQAQGESAKATSATKNSATSNTSGFSDALAKLLMINNNITGNTGEGSDASVLPGVVADPDVETASALLADLVDGSGDNAAAMATDISAILAQFSDGGTISLDLTDGQAGNAQAATASGTTTTAEVASLQATTAEQLNLLSTLTANPNAQDADAEPAGLSPGITVPTPPVTELRNIQSSVVPDSLAVTAGGHRNQAGVNALAGSTEILPTRVAIERAGPETAPLPAVATVAPVIVDTPPAIMQELRKQHVTAGNSNSVVSAPAAVSTAAVDSALQETLAGQNTTSTAAANAAAQTMNQTAEKLAANAESVQAAITSSKSSLLQNTAATADLASNAPADAPRSVLHQLTSLTDLNRSEPALMATRTSATGAPATTANAVPPEISMTAARNVQWMLDQGVSRATLQLHPAELGSLKINLNVQDEQLSIQISATQAGTREALEVTLPKLRDQLAQQGFQDVNIDLTKHDDNANTNTGSSDRHDDTSEDADNRQTTASTGNSDETDQSSDVAGPRASSGNGLVDMFA